MCYRLIIVHNCGHEDPAKIIHCDNASYNPQTRRLTSCTRPLPIIRTSQRNTWCSNECYQNSIELQIENWNCCQCNAYCSGPYNCYCEHTKCHGCRKRSA